VHGGPGANAARAALRAGTTGRLALAATRALVGRPPGGPRTTAGDDPGPTVDHASKVARS